MDLQQLTRMEKSHQYITGMRPVINRRALFSDTTEEFVSPSEPRAYDQIVIRFRAARDNVDRVFFVCKGEKYLMFKERTEENFEYYVHELQLENEKIAYHFEVRVGKITVVYDSRGAVREEDEHYNFVVIPGFQTPEWAKGAVMYQIYVDRFCNGDPENDVQTNEYFYIGGHSKHVEDWNEYPASVDVQRFYGGDLQGVLNKLDYIQELGIEAIYFNPLFVSPSNHKYDIQDYDYIDPHIGKIKSDEGDLLQPEQKENRFATKYRKRVTDKENLEASNTLFIKVVEEAHKRGIKVILDGVFNHCGSFNKWMDRERIYENTEGYEKGAFLDSDSPYRNYFLFRDENRWPYNPTYTGWWDHDTLPKLNYEGSRALFDYMMHIAKKWVSPPFNVDGWRLDVAADLGFNAQYNHCFWQEFRKAVKEANPNAIILAEHYGDSADWLQGNEWDTVMNYDAFMEPVTWFLTGMEKHSDDYREDLYGNAESFWNSMRYHQASFSMPSLQVAMNQLSNHDHSRFLTRTNQKVGRNNSLGAEAADRDVRKAVFMEAVVMQMTWPGAPTIYYGDEAGLCGFTDPDNRRTYPWGNEDRLLVELHKELIRLRKEHKELRTGSLKYVDSDFNYLAYGRFRSEGQSVVLINNNDYEVVKELSVWELNIPKETTLTRQIQTYGEGYDTRKEEFSVVSGKIQVTLPATSATLLTHRKKIN